MCVYVLSCVWLFATPWTIARQAPPLGSSIHGIFQARILGCIAIFYSREFSQPRDWTHVSCISCIGRWILYHWALQRFTHCHSPHLLAVLFLSGRFSCELESSSCKFPCYLFNNPREECLFLNNPDKKSAWHWTSSHIHLWDMLCDTDRPRLHYGCKSGTRE